MVSKSKEYLFFGLKVVIALAAVNLLTKTLLGVNVAMFIEDPMGAVKSKLG